MKIIGLIGMPGSGKSEASKVAHQMGLPVVVMGDVIRQEAMRLDFEPTDENLGKVGNMLREQEGPSVIAKRTMEMARRLGKKIVIVDGLRSKAEVDLFRSSLAEFKLVEIWSPPEARLKRIMARGRLDDANFGSIVDSAKIIKSAGDVPIAAADTLERRDIRELSWGIYEAIKEADLRVCNEGDLDQFRRSVQEMLKNLISNKTPVS